MVDVSVIICTYNRSQSLAKTLASLERMTGLETIDWEAIVVDNNSKDDTRQVVGRFVAAPGSRFRYVFEKEQGLSHARNRGIREASGAVIAFTDDDVILDPYWLANMYKEFENDGVACVGGKILPVWETPRPGWLRGELLNFLALQDLGEERILLEHHRIWGANLGIRTSMFRKYGGFDTGLGRTEEKLYAGEETKFIRMLLERGETVLYSPYVLVHHCIPGFRMKKTYFRKWLYHNGEMKGKQMGDYRKRNIYGIPLYAVRDTVRYFLKYLWSQIASPGTAFQDQLTLMHSFGFIGGRIRYRRETK